MMSCRRIVNTVEQSTRIDEDRRGNLTSWDENSSCDRQNIIFFFLQLTKPSTKTIEEKYKLTVSYQALPSSFFFIRKILINIYKQTWELKLQGL